ncbi:metalloregulator ArsR/SmtB family transcription factor [Chitinivorax sp. B]|uniref:metalloregulator ArsR/SmtB family transcription factor n=1 Tax=Chitinivorax sp. B TaxID=2502235 RepID=UPI0010F9E9BA|nr:metalloregulator ArsR/SmtB family transcription factor [Chitinivorax sp. B]
MITDIDFFNVLSDETRRRMLSLLLTEDELSVCELCHAVDCAQPKVSRHLAKMRQSKLLAVRRDGVWMYYRINPQLPAWAFKIVQLMAQAGESTQLLVRDRNRLLSMPDRPIRESRPTAPTTVTPMQPRVAGGSATVFDAGVRLVR